MLLALALGAVTLQAQQTPAMNVCTRANLKQSVKIGEVTFAAYRDEDSGCLQVIRDGKVIFRRTDGLEYALGQYPDPNERVVPRIANGTDITGRGYPDMIVWEWTGGAHCCFSNYVFELGPKFRLVAHLEAVDGDEAHFEDLDKNHQYYFLGADWTFDYWPGSFAGSPRAPVVLRFVDGANGGAYHLALDKMREPAPSDAEWKKDVQAARDTITSDAMGIDSGATVWDPILNLIYYGHPDLAWKFLDEAWPANFKDNQGKSKDDWLGDFCSILKTSQYWPDLKPSMKTMPPACAAAKSDPSFRR